MHATELVTQSCVVAGSMNPGIIHPEWLRKENILTGEEAWELEFVELGAPTPAFRDSKLMWQCRYDRMIVTSLKDADAGESVALVLEKLSHTPITAVGNNFHFKLSRAEDRTRLFKEMLSQPFESLASRKLPPISSTATFQIGRNDALLNLTLESSKADVHTLVFNYHRPANSAANATGAARQWKNDRSDAHEVLSIFLDQ